MPHDAEVAFAKYHGLGNDFIVVRGPGLPASPVELARQLLHRHTGVGADGLVLLLPPRDKKHDLRVRFFNADGSEAEMSGNGIRCAAAFVRETGSHKRSLAIETVCGVKVLRTLRGEEGKWIFRARMGLPVFSPAKIPFKGGRVRGAVVGFPLRTHRGVLPVTVISMGNPHCSVFVADFAGIDWGSLGREIEHNELFPQRTNVEFIKVLSKKEIEVRFWERGVGHTTSSGTGSCAAVVACVLNGKTQRTVHVRTLAGTLEVAWRKQGEVTLTGPVERIARGVYYFRCQD